MPSVELRRNFCLANIPTPLWFGDAARRPEGELIMDLARGADELEAS